MHAITTVAPAAHLPATLSTSQQQANHFRAQEALSFRLATEEYAIPLLCVQEIRSYQEPTRIAGSSPQWLGVIDLRGEVVPLLDMRHRLSLAATAVGPMTVIIIVSVSSRSVGLVVDQVNDVIALSGEQIRAMPPLALCPDHRHMHAMGVVNDRRLVLLDIQGLLVEDLTNAPILLRT